MCIYHAAVVIICSSTYVCVLLYVSAVQEAVFFVILLIFEVRDDNMKRNLLFNASKRGHNPSFDVWQSIGNKSFRLKDRISHNALPWCPEPLTASLISLQELCVFFCASPQMRIMRSSVTNEGKCALQQRLCEGSSQPHSSAHLASCCVKWFLFSVCLKVMKNVRLWHQTCVSVAPEKPFLHPN